MTELAGSRVEIGVIVRDRIVRAAVFDHIDANIGMPRFGVIDLHEVDVEHLTADVEHAGHHPVEWEVLGDQVVVDAVVALSL